MNTSMILECPHSSLYFELSWIDQYLWLVYSTAWTLCPELWIPSACTPLVLCVILCFFISIQGRTRLLVILVRSLPWLRREEEPTKQHNVSPTHALTHRMKTASIQVNILNTCKHNQFENWLRKISTSNAMYLPTVRQQKPSSNLTDHGTGKCER